MHLRNNREQNCCRIESLQIAHFLNDRQYKPFSSFEGLFLEFLFDKTMFVTLIAYFC